MTRRTPFDHDRDEIIDPAERRRDEYRALATIRLTMARVCRAGGDIEGERSAVACARAWKRAAADEAALILTGAHLL